jgi:hypothetical protein
MTNLVALCEFCFIPAGFTLSESRYTVDFLRGALCPAKNQQHNQRADSTYDRFYVPDPKLG